MAKSVASCPKRLWRVVQGIVAGCPGYCGGMSRVLWRVVLGRVVFVASCLDPAYTYVCQIWRHLIEPFSSNRAYKKVVRNKKNKE